jgi:hypothetical protein
MGLFGRSKSEKQAMARAMQIAEDNAAYMKGLELPELEWRNFTPEEMEATTISEDPALRQIQLRALEKMSGLAETGLSAEDELGFFKARQVGDQMARAGTQNAIENAAARGVGGSGLEFAMRESASQGGAQRAQEAALERAAVSARERALANQAYGQAAGGVRSQDLGVNQANTNIINQFNQANTTARNNAQMYNREQANATKQQNFQNDFQKRGAVTGANQQVAQNYLADAASSASNRNAMIGAGIGAGTAIATGGASLFGDAAKKKAGT